MPIVSRMTSMECAGPAYVGSAGSAHPSAVGEATHIGGTSLPPQPANAVDETMAKTMANDSEARIAREDTRDRWSLHVEGRSQR